MSELAAAPPFVLLFALPRLLASFAALLCLTLLCLFASTCCDLRDGMMQSDWRCSEAGENEEREGDGLQAGRWSDEQRAQQRAEAFHSQAPVRTSLLFQLGAQLFAALTTAAAQSRVSQPLQQRA